MPAQIPDRFTLLSQLISIPSISCVDPKLDQSNQSIIEHLANWCHDLGLDTHILSIDDHPGKFNLVATLGNLDMEGGLLLSGHTDTVPYDMQQWQCDPFCLTEQKGRWYGLGTSDMKSFFALALEAIQHFKSKQFHRPLTLLATADEESTMCGVKELLNTHRLQARYAVIGEPTNLYPVRMHKGVMMESIHLQGSSGHSSDPRLGNSALEGMHRVITELLAWRTQLQATYHNPVFSVPVPTLNLGHIHGGDNPNRICGTCELHIDLRPLPGMSIEELRSLLQQRIRQAIADSGLQVTFKSFLAGVPPMETPATSHIVTAMERLTQETAQAVAFGTEAPFLQQMGIETVIIGAGDIAQAHQPNEFIESHRLQPMVDILTQVIEQFCIHQDCARNSVDQGREG